MDTASSVLRLHERRGWWREDQRKHGTGVDVRGQQCRRGIVLRQWSMDGFGIRALAQH